MSQRSCNHLTGDTPCSAVVHTTVRVGVPGHGPVWVALCFAHKDAGDLELEILARAKIARKTSGAIQSYQIKPGLTVRQNATGSVGRVALVTETGVRVVYQNGTSLGCSKRHLKKNYSHPTLKPA